MPDEWLRRAKENPGESLSDVVMRARWDNRRITAGEFLRRVRERGRGPTYGAEQLSYLDGLKALDAPPEDKWRGGFSAKS